MGFFVVLLLDTLLTQIISKVGARLPNSAPVGLPYWEYETSKSFLQSRTSKELDVLCEDFLFFIVFFFLLSLFSKAMNVDVNPKSVALLQPHFN